MEESVSLLKAVKEVFGCGEQDVRQYSPLALAYIGDAVYDLVIRSVVVERANRPSRDLHRETVRYVNAVAQAQMIHLLLGELTEEELAVYKRGRNAKPYTFAKNSSIQEYKQATGYEALVGYLYLTDRMDRLLALVKRGIELAGMKL